MYTMDYLLKLAQLSCLLWIVSGNELQVYWAVHPGERYENVSRLLMTSYFGECSSRCAKERPSDQCLAFNFRESDGACELLHGGSSRLIPANGFQAYAQFLCVTDYPTIKNAKPTFEGWKGEYPAPQGASVRFACDTGFTDGSKEHRASCSCSEPDLWCTTFVNSATDLCTP
ncbi:unnamed protein product [Darwinula stevensoni]|uniref:Apple domain-containing protein n=1 Tax=Darwinula stevensoni TaxID=69355 RepID=A0A7R9FPW7_9CRUS|nr:unnamed protein product [Darwinula stevensoni]CAG0898643.1 unnamed protein product [Darwinula stevensoni]